MNKSLLIVEDREEFIKPLASALKDEYILNFAKSLDVAKRAINTLNYDAILTDVNLTNAYPLGGIEIVSLASSKNIPCLVMSKENHEKEAMEAGAYGFLFKKELLLMLDQDKNLSCLFFNGDR